MPVRMDKNNTRKKLDALQSGKGLLLIYLFLAVLMVASALLELRQSKEDLFQLMRAQSHSLLESLLIASANILRTDSYLSEYHREKTLDQAYMIKTLYESDRLTRKNLDQIAEQNNLYSVCIIDPDDGELLRSPADSNPVQYSIEALFPVFTGDVDTLIPGFYKERAGTDYYYSVALSAANRRAVLVTVEATSIIEARRHGGFGILLRNIAADNRNIVYAALQDTTAILAASGNVSELGTLSESIFLTRAYRDSLFETRITLFDSTEVFEAVHPFVFDGQKLGLFRLGLSLDALDVINDRIVRRLAIITLILIILGSVFFTYVFLRQRYRILHQEYKTVETYSGNIIENVSDVIIVAGEKSGIRIFNKAAENLFKKSKKEVYGKALPSIIQEEFWNTIRKSGQSMVKIDYPVKGRLKRLLASQNSFQDANGETNYIVLFRDLTQVYQLESQIQRKARLSAMGELAAGVAHEIRNPLNTIGTIAQQLKQDFIPLEGTDEYQQLNVLVIEEVKRIDQTIQDFLKFTKPQPLKKEAFKFSEWLNQITLQFKKMLSEKNIRFKIDNNFDGEVDWDKNQMRQVMLNLIQNAVDAIDTDGSIALTAAITDDASLQIIIEDNGAGIPDEIQDRIFNLYFSTKSNGSGIGLSIVQRIIQDHNGSIQLESKPGKGAKFILLLPLK